MLAQKYEEGGVKLPTGTAEHQTMTDGVREGRKEGGIGGKEECVRTWEGRLSVCGGCGGFRRRVKAEQSHHHRAGCIKTWQ